MLTNSDLEVSKKLIDVSSFLVGSADMISLSWSYRFFVTKSPLDHTVLVWEWRANVVLCYEVTQERYKHTNCRILNKRLTITNNFFIIFFSTCAAEKCLNKARFLAQVIQDFASTFIASMRWFLQQTVSASCKMLYFIGLFILRYQW